MVKGLVFMSKQDRLWTLKETAEFLQVSANTLYQMNWKGTGPRSFRVGRYRRYDPADVRVWLEGNATAERGPR